jgi:3-hydroxyacyl-CoA dehydrogenase, NAD binding domain/Peptidase dimerisation domain
MGSGIALCFARASSAVVLTARRAITLAAARARIGQSLEQLTRAGVLEATRPAAVTARIATTTDLEQAVDGVELVVETVVEDLAVKHDVLAGAQRAEPPGTVIATDTSSIAIDELAAVLATPRSSPACTGSTPPSSSPWWRSCRGIVHNIVPERCELTVDIRFPPEQTADDVLRDMHAAIARAIPEEPRLPTTVRPEATCRRNPRSSLRLSEDHPARALALGGTRGRHRPARPARLPPRPARHSDHQRRRDSGCHLWPGLAGVLLGRRMRGRR